MRKILNGEYERREGKSMFNKEKWLPLARDAPFLISHYCCFKMKKSPMHKYQTAHKYKPILATLAEESRVRKQGWIRHGCNAFESKTPMSQPMSFWTEQDVLAYIVKYNVQIASDSAISPFVPISHRRETSSFWHIPLASTAVVISAPTKAFIHGGRRIKPDRQY